MLSRLPLCRELASFSSAAFILITELVQISIKSQQLACKILVPRDLLTVVNCRGNRARSDTDAYGTCGLHHDDMS